ncbi:MAG: hypothetical protein FH762_00015 [Firmicutes bacterium]|nr:hypothetical protein [Bacillota bacterium]
MINKRVIIFIILVAMLLLVSSCDMGSSVKKTHVLSIYLVKDLSTKEAMERNIDELLLESFPVLTDKEVERYNWEKQTFYIKDGISLEQKLEGKVPLDGKPFVLTVDGERIYLGSFWNLLSSLYYFDIPTINSVWSGEIDNKKYHIQYGLEGQDPRDDRRIYSALKSLGKLD